VVINGEPWGGADWAPGHRSYWHCHRGGQILLMWDGEGRIQNRGERVRTLQRSEMSHAPPWTEHWHGGSPDTHGHWLQVSVQPVGTFWMEEVGDEDYLGNDIGINSRNEFLATGVKEKYPNR
jgi:4-carboxymuconolactone decarboxylase